MRMEYEIVRRGMMIDSSNANIKMRVRVIVIGRSHRA